GGGEVLTRGGVAVDDLGDSALAAEVGRQARRHLPVRRVRLAGDQHHEAPEALVPLGQPGEEMEGALLQPERRARGACAAQLDEVPGSQGRGRRERTPVCAGQRGEGERERRFGTGGGDDRCEARVELDACAQEDDVALEGGEPEETDERREGEWAGLVGSRLS